MIHRYALALVALIAVPSMAAAPAPIAGRWKTDDGKGIVVMAACGNKMCGRVERLLIKQPAGGQLDERNPDKAKRGRKVTGLAYKDRGTGDAHRLALDGIFVQIGLLPNTEWLKGTVELSPRGEIVIDARGETSLPGVFAAGDASTVPYKQIIIAMGAGATAALSAFDHLIRHSTPAEVAEAVAA